MTNEDFLNTIEQGVINAANLSFLMVNLSFPLLQSMKFPSAEFSLLDLKAIRRDYIYVQEVLELIRKLAVIPIK